MSCCTNSLREPTLKCVASLHCPYRQGPKFWGTKVLASLARMQSFLLTVPVDLFYAVVLCMECFLIACFHMLGWNANEEWYDPDQADSRNVPRHQARTLWCGLHSGSFIQETWSVSLDCERARVIVQSVTWRQGLHLHGRPCHSHCVQETWLCLSKLANVPESFCGPHPR